MVTQPPENRPLGFGGYLSISAYGAALSFFWPSLHSLVIPLVLLSLVPETQKNTYLSILTAVGLALAVIIQPLSGAVSDCSTSRWGRRRPYIVLGTALIILFLPGLGFSTSFGWLFVSYCLLQVASNIAQGPCQAFIPDLVTAERHGTAAGVKSLAEAVSGVVFVRVVASFLDNYSVSGNRSWLWLTLGFAGLILIAAMVVTVLAVKERDSGIQRPSLSLKTLVNAYRINFRQHHDFVWFLASRLLVMMGLVTLQTFVLYFLMDRLGVTSPAGATGNIIIALGAGLLTVSYFGGRLSDRIGRKSVIVISGLIGVAAMVWLLLARNLGDVVACGVLLGISAGGFLSSDWALATDLVPKGEEGRYLGLTNVATAGAGILARGIGPVIDVLNLRQPGLGYTAMLLVCILYFGAGSALVYKIRGSWANASQPR